VTFTRIATYRDDVFTILTSTRVNCQQCHFGSPGTDNISFSPPVGPPAHNLSYSQLLNNVSSTDPRTVNRRLVVPGDSTGSYFHWQVKWDDFTATHGVASFDRMPNSTTFACLSATPSPRCLTPAERRIVGIWIQQGAVQNPP
jgi:hypothetical protein